MDEYIKRIDANYAVTDAIWHGKWSMHDVASAINSVPAADVAPVRHARWVKRGCKWQCTNCKVLMSIDGTPKENLLNYCPNCGAKMDGGED